MSGKNKYERWKNGIVIILAGTLFFGFIFCGILSAIKNKPLKAPLEKELSSLNDKIKEKKKSILELDSTLKELSSEKVLIENFIEEYNSKLDLTIGNVPSFQIDGQVWYCFNTKELMLKVLTEDITNRGFSILSDPAFDIFATGYRTTSYDTNVISQMKMLKKLYAYNCTSTVNSSNVYTIVYKIYWREASNILESYITYKVKVGSSW